MRAFLLAAGYGRRFRPVTDAIPKPLFPFLNVPLIRQHLARLRRHGILEAGVNLHHLGEQIERELRDGAADLPELRFFPESRILGTAGALRNAAEWLSDGDFLLVNTDTVLDPDFDRLVARHRESGRAATLLAVENRDPGRYTPLQSEGDRITGIGTGGANPLLYTGVCVLSPRLLSRIPLGETALAADLWIPLLRDELEEIGWVLHEGTFSDLGRPSDFLRASLEALDRGGPFPDGGGSFDPAARLLSLLPDSPRDFEASRCVVGKAAVGRNARLSDSTVWNGVEIGSGASLRGCLAAAGKIPAGVRHEAVLLWPGENGIAVPHPLS
jgi:NDP-sugar pyrophosphorylase family protein